MQTGRHGNCVHHGCLEVHNTYQMVVMETMCTMATLKCTTHTKWLSWTVQIGCHGACKLVVIDCANRLSWTVQIGCHGVCKLVVMDCANWLSWTVQTGCHGTCKLVVMECANWLSWTV